MGACPEAEDRDNGERNPYDRGNPAEEGVDGRRLERQRSKEGDHVKTILFGRPIPVTRTGLQTIVAALSGFALNDAATAQARIARMMRPTVSLIFAACP